MNLKYVSQYNWNKRNKDKVRKTQKEWRKRNIVKMRVYSREYMKEYRKTEKHKKYRKSQEFLEKNKIWAAKYRKEYPDKIKKMRDAWREKNRENPRYKIDNSMASAICIALKGNKNRKKWQRLIGYTLKELMVHLENLFTSQMSWANYGSYWEVDHIKPKSLFKYDFPQDQAFKDCWELKNLQPLEVMANRIKATKFLARIKKL